MHQEHKLSTLPPPPSSLHAGPAGCPLTSALEDERGATDLQSVDEKKKERLQGLNPGCSLTLLTAQRGGGGVGSPVQTWGLLTARGCGGQEDYTIHLSLKESIAVPPTHVQPR